MNIIDLKQELEASKRKSERVNAEIKAIEEKAEHFRGLAQNAAEADNADQYLAMKYKAEKAEAEAYVKKVSLEKSEKHFTQQEIIAAWNEYIKKYSKTFDERLNKYNQVLNQAKCLFEDMLDAQREALKWREYASDLAGLPRVFSFDDSEIRRVFQMPFIPWDGVRNSDTTAAAMFYNKDDDTRARVNLLLKTHMLR